MPPDLCLTESTPLAEASPGNQQSGRMLVQAMSAGLGNAGYYSPAVLREAAANKLIAKGTPLFLDHPAESEKADRPERSVRDIAAVFTENARFENDALVGEVQVFGPYRDLLSEMAPHIGLSVTGSATDITEGKVGGKTVPIVAGLAKIDSVDFVTKGARGGEVKKVFESARGEALTEAVARLQLAEARNVGQWIESRLHLELTQIADNMFGDGRLTRDERIALSSAVGDGLTAFTASLGGAAPALYQRDLWAEPDQMYAASESGDPPPEPDDPNPADPAPTDPPADPAPEPPTPVEENEMPPDDQGAPTRSPRQVIEAQLAEMRGQVAQMAARERARHIIAETLGDAWLTPSVVTRLTGELIESLPIVNDSLDEQALRDQTTAARDRAEAEVAEALTAAGVGRPRGLGALTESTGGTGPDLTDRLEESFRALGMSESAAALAAKGR